MKKTLLVVLIIAAILITGCSDTKSISLINDQLETQQKTIDDLVIKNVSLVADLAEFRELEKSLYQTIDDLKIEIDNLKNEVSSISIYDHFFKLSVNELSKTNIHTNSGHYGLRVDSIEEVVNGYKFKMLFFNYMPHDIADIKLKFIIPDSADQIVNEDNMKEFKTIEKSIMGTIEGAHYKIFEVTLLNVSMENLEKFYAYLDDLKFRSGESK
jgi:hypothetical protein